MKICGLQKLSLTDYDGYLCATIFLGGCNFLCPYCHNKDLVFLENIKSFLSEEYVLTFLKERKNILEAVCISGGEPTLTLELVLFLKKIKALGYKIKLDTNGSTPKILESLLKEKIIDYVALDIKNDMFSYPETIGLEKFNFNLILESLAVLKKTKTPYELRTTLVKEFHNEKTILNIGNTLKNEKVLFLQKFVDNGTCIKNGLNEVEKPVAEKYQKMLSKFIKNVFLRGY